MVQAATPAAVAQPATRGRGRRLSKLAVFALLAAAIAPSMQVLRDAAGGRWIPADPAQSRIALTVLDSGAVLLFIAAIIAGLIALAQVIGRPELRGGALAVGALILAVAGMCSGVLGITLGGSLGELLPMMGGGGGVYFWGATAVVAGAAIVAEIVIAAASPSIAP
jgi:hypothetical protein